MADQNELGKPNGSAAAAFLAAGIGSAILGIATVGAEASAGLRNALIWSRAAGPLSGKTSVALIGWIVAWLVFGLAWKGKTLRLAGVLVISAVLVAVGLLLTFPPFFGLFAPE